MKWLGIGFDVHSQILLMIGECSKNIVSFGVDNSSSRHTNNRTKDILIFGEESTNGFDNTTTMLEAKYSVNITKSRKFFCLNLHCNVDNSSLYANGVCIQVQNKRL